MHKLVTLAWQILINRATERSTWVGLLFVLSAMGVHLSPDMEAEIIKTGMAMAGGLMTVIPDKPKIIIEHKAECNCKTDLN